jgi:hypothetical protein
LVGGTDRGTAGEGFRGLVAIQEAIGVFALQKEHVLYAAGGLILRVSVQANVDSGFAFFQDADGDAGAAVRGLDDSFFVIDFRGYLAIVGEGVLAFFQFGTERSGQDFYVNLFDDILRDPLRRIIFVAFGHRQGHACQQHHSRDKFHFATLLSGSCKQTSGVRSAAQYSPAGRVCG